MNRVLVGIGVDIVHVPRIARLARHRTLLTRICAPHERSNIPDDDLSYACTWAIKEAVAKTLGTGFWQSGVEWREVCIAGRWQVTLEGRARAIAGESSFDVEVHPHGDYVTVTVLRWANA
ncbi:MAG: 4'-phosphopantetheinyl transferase superfamily protein [Myxococcota bacterium]|nr:4'-phosphopantetheinyl transferase superfamily protein [Myxococcota bacterium]